jgi:RNA polymerase sigma-70 factor (ECF subfamily)
MRQVKAGDGGAFDVLFRRHYARVHGLCARLVCDPVVADDLAQDTFIRVLRLGRTFRERSRFTTWLYRVARNVCLDHVKRVRRIAVVDGQAFEADVANGNDARLHLLERALTMLAPERREAIVLSRFHDLPYEELAEVLNCSAGAARVRVHRALLELKQIVHQLEGQDERVSSRA